MTLYRIEKGKLGEKKALSYLRKNNFKILEKNYRTKIGEIDIIALKNKIVYFIEVKARTDIRKGLPYEAVNYRKIKHIKNTAYYFLLNSKYKDYKLKLAVISIILDNKGENLKFYDDLK